MSRLTKANIYLSVGLVFCLSCLSTLATEAIATPIRAIVNSNQDGVITPDAVLTLREAIALVNGDLLPTQLSAAGTAQVTLLKADALSVEIYRSGESAGTRELIGKPIAKITANEQGQISVTLSDLQAGDGVSGSCRAEVWDC